MSPSENASGSFAGETHISRRGRPGLRLTVWRAVWPLLAHNPVMAAKFAALTQDEAAAGDSPGPSRKAAMAAARARRARARVACAASLLRWIWSLVVHGTCWNAEIAAGQLSHHHAIAA